MRLVDSSPGVQAQRWRYPQRGIEFLVLVFAGGETLIVEISVFPKARS